jgi:iron complex transport system ATP-binding protein
MLAATEVSVMRGARRVLTGVSLRVHPGELVGVLGANGAGKSSLLAVLAGELKPTAGKVALDGQSLDGWSTRALARCRAVLPQRAELIADMTVREVVEMGAYPFPARSSACVNARVEDAMARADVSALAARRYLAISGGEQQRVHLARVIAQVLIGVSADSNGAAEGAAGMGNTAGRHGYLLLDEPTASQDPSHQLQALYAARALAANGRVGVVTALHDINLAARWCDRVVLLAEGRLLAEGPPQDVLTVAHIKQVYDVDAVVISHPLNLDRNLVVY